MEKDKCCANCKFLRRLKYNFKSGTGFQHSYCCIVQEYDKEANKNNYNDAWIQEISLYDMCEMFTDGKNCFNQREFV